MQFESPDMERRLLPDSHTALSGLYTALPFLLRLAWMQLRGRRDREKNAGGPVKSEQSVLLRRLLFMIRGGRAMCTRRRGGGAFKVLR